MVALTVENGTGVAGADSYGSLADSRTFHAKRGNAAWAAATDDEAEVALRLTADYIDTWHLGGGARLSGAQGLAFPYSDLDDTVKAQQLDTVRRAQFMLAPLALQGDLVQRAAEEAQVVQETNKVGDLSESKTYANVQDSRTVLAGHDVSWLEKMLGGIGSSGGMVIGTRYRG